MESIPESKGTHNSFIWNMLKWQDFSKTRKTQHLDHVRYISYMISTGLHVLTFSHKQIDIPILTCFFRANFGWRNYFSTEYWDGEKKNLKQIFLHNFQYVIYVFYGKITTSVNRLCFHYKYLDSFYLSLFRHLRGNYFKYQTVRETK